MRYCRNYFPVLYLTLTVNLLIAVNSFGEIPVNKSLVYIIHEDYQYQYYAGNKQRNAATEILAAAKRTARNCKDCEVFIFLFRPFRTGFCFMAKTDLKSYYYRNGKKILKQEGRRKSMGRDLTERGSFYRNHSTATFNAWSYMIYFGARIPEAQGEGYSSSYPDESFSVSDMATALKAFQRRFTALLLSSPESGTPYKIHSLCPYAEYILASAGNPGLPYLGLTPPWFLPDQQHSLGRKYLQRLTEDIFKNMSRSVLTPVSVVLYESQKVKPWLHSILKEYQRLQNRMQQPATGSSRDCLSFEGFKKPGFDAGVWSFYQPGAWSQEKSPETHSGWSCPVQNQGRPEEPLSATFPVRSGAAGASGSLVDGFVCGSVISPFSHR